GSSAGLEHQDGVVSLESHKTRLATIFRLEVARSAFTAGGKPTGPLIGEERNSARVRSGCLPPVLKDCPSGGVSQDHRRRIQTTVTQLVHNWTEMLRAAHQQEE